MRRIANISQKLVLTRVSSDGSEEVLGRHAFIRAGDKIRARSSAPSYGDIGYTTELSSGGDARFVELDIAKGHSRERLDVYGSDFSLTTISKKVRFDYERYKRQIDIERRRGVSVGWKGGFITCMFSSRNRSREYKEGGFDVGIEASFVANIRQFSVMNELKLPAPKDAIVYDGEKFLIESVNRDITNITISLSRDRGRAVL